jgi:hypothetical protein
LIVLLLVIALGFTAWFLSKWQENAALVARLRNATTNLPPPAAATPAVETPRTESRWNIKVSTNFVSRENPGARSASRSSGVPVRDDPAASETSTPGSSTTATNIVANADANATQVEPTNSFPALKLQSIVYRLSKPAVVINGEMLFAGDRIKEVRILKIDRYEVIVEWRGQTNTLTLPRL